MKDPLKTTTFKKLVIKRSLLKALSQPSEPCTNGEESPNTSACIAKWIHDQMGCRFKIHGGSDLNKGKLCNSRSQYLNLSRIFSKLQYADAETVYEMTGCLASCEKFEYEISGYSVELSSKSRVPRRICDLTLGLEMNDASFEEKKQFFVYDFNSVVADVGGFMGLLLGFSMLSIYGELEKQLRRLTPCKNNKKVLVT